MEKLLIVGGGPKAIAVSVKAALLRKHSKKTPEVVIIDKYGVASNWNGANGFTSGKHSLGTPPEKDVCFPYKSSLDYCHKKINSESFMYSWPVFLTEKGFYQEWIDRGKPSPTHMRWAEYLCWCAAKSGASIQPGEVVSIGIDGDQWKVSFNTDEGPGHIKEILAENIMITGPGVPISISPSPSMHAFYRDGQNYWNDNYFQSKLLDKAKSTKIKIGVIGGGETSASIIVNLIDFFSDQGIDENIEINIINRRATVFSRGENFHENKFFTNPAGWEKLSYELREEFINRTDRGVFSLQTLHKINNCEFVHHVFGNVKSISSIGPKLRVRFSDEKLLPQEYDTVINALGFDNMGFIKMMEDSFFNKIGLFQNWFDDHTNRDEFRKKIDFNLSYAPLDRPKLFLPMLSAMEQGPGFPNLSCLGTLSDRILSHFLK
ncbi:MAG TPA: SidA/IucD/PvdA family monooxygenase [Chitinophagaceae bacterium]|jgi:mycobactin lysine-N-oxygenase|nr:SidA/IucD/PvdA family monooxygenase [Chitinophagaceae bacterium]